MYVKGVKDMSNIALYWGVYLLNYTVDPNTKSSNYNKIQLKALNYFKLETLWIRQQFNLLELVELQINHVRINHAL